MFHAGWGTDLSHSSDDFNSAQYLFLFEGSASYFELVGVRLGEHCRPIVRVGQDLDINMFNIHQVEFESFWIIFWRRA